MQDPLSEAAEEIRQCAKSGGLPVFFGCLAKYNGPTMEWDEKHGGGWKGFLECAKTLGVKVVYLTCVPFEQSVLDEAVSKLESELAESGGAEGESEAIRRRLDQVRELTAKIGSTCMIELAFVADGVLHICQKAAQWLQEFRDLLPTDGNEDASRKQESPAGKATVDKWATALASDPRYIGCRGYEEREFLLEKIAGNEFQEVPVPEVLSRAETVFHVEFRQAAEEKLASEVRRLREQGLNLNAIALKLGISRDRVSGLLSAYSTKAGSG